MMPITNRLQEILKIKNKSYFKIHTLIYYAAFCPLVVEDAAFLMGDIMDDNIKYAMKLAFLNQLYGKEMLTEKEYSAIKIDLMKKHKIIVA